MRISGTELSSVINSQTIQKWERDVPKQAQAKRDDVINPQN